MTKEEIAQLKNEYETLSDKLKDLSEEEIKEVTGGAIGDWNNIEHQEPNIHINNRGQYDVFYGQPIKGSNNTDGCYIPLDSEEKLKS